ncbi:hypothetical protein DE4576_05539 [Mycobacterium marinum]|nr:hypothetical protein DE4576_05539 [Mycobacterium marinum]
MAGGVVAGDDDGLIYPVECGQGGGDFAAFDAVATDFDLFISAAQILQLPIPVECGQGGGDFAAFDAVATDFDLFISAAQILQLPIRAPTHQITGAIHPRPARPERAGDKPGRTQPAPAPIADTDTGAGDIQLTHGPGRHRAQPAIEDEYPGPGHGCADGHHCVRGV